MDGMPPPIRPANSRSSDRGPGLTEPRGPARFLEEYLYAAVDVETTGLFVGYHHRVIEVGVVLFDLEGGVHGEFESLINPRRDVSAEEIHGLSASDLAYAPSFEELCPEIISALTGRVLVAHNARFDSEFLTAEFERALIHIPEVPQICTMQLAARSGFGRTLDDACSTLGITRVNKHTAIDDARATAELFMRWFSIQREEGEHPCLRELGCLQEPATDAWPQGLEGKGQAVVRSEASRRAAAERSYLAGLIERLPSEPRLSEPRVISYLDLLCRALEDRYLSRQEAEALAVTARNDGLSSSEVEQLHAQFFESLAAAAWQDGVVTNVEKADLELVAEFLNIQPQVVNQALHEPPVQGVSHARPGHHPLLVPGTTVCFTGALKATINGDPVTREQAEESAKRAGLIVLSSVTKKLNVLVVADPQSLSGKAQKARQYGTLIVAEAVFWSEIGVRTD